LAKEVVMPVIMNGVLLSAYISDIETPQLVQQEQLEDDAFSAQPVDPCAEGHVWVGARGVLWPEISTECSICNATFEGVWL
jgi:hypothetical protein